MISVIIADLCRRHGKANTQDRHKNQSSIEEEWVCFVLLLAARCWIVGEYTCGV